MKKFIYIAILLVFSAWMVSCDGFLTTDNKSNVTDKEYFSTKSGLNPWYPMPMKLYGIFMPLPVIQPISMQVRTCMPTDATTLMMNCMNMKP